MAGNKFENLISEIATGRYQRLSPHGTYLGEYIVHFKKDATDAQKKKSLLSLLTDIFNEDYKDGRKTIRIEYEWFINGKTKTKYILRAYRVSVPNPPKATKAEQPVAGKTGAGKKKASSAMMRMAAGDQPEAAAVSPAPSGSSLDASGAETASMSESPDPSGPILTPPNVSVSTVQTNALVPVTDTVDDGEDDA